MTLGPGVGCVRGVGELAAFGRRSPGGFTRESPRMLGRRAPVDSRARKKLSQSCAEAGFLFSTRMVPTWRRCEINMDECMQFVGPCFALPDGLSVVFRVLTLPSSSSQKRTSYVRCRVTGSRGRLLFFQVSLEQAMHTACSSRNLPDSCCMPVRTSNQRQRHKWPARFTRGGRWSRQDTWGR